MIAANVDQFYRKVIEDMITGLSKNEFMLRELQQHNIFLNQIEEKMLEKLTQSHTLFKRLTLGYNQIEKEMLSRYSSVDEIIYNERKIRLNSQSRSVRRSEPSESVNDDLDCYAPSSQSNLSRQSKRVKQEPENDDDSGEGEGKGEALKKQEQSEMSFDDLSEMDVEHADTLKRSREDAKIHILGTYDNKSKKHDFKRDKTKIVLEDVFIKVEGVAKEIFLPKLTCVSKKRGQQ